MSNYAERVRGSRFRQQPCQIFYGVVRDGDLVATWDASERQSCMSARMSAKMGGGKVWMVTPTVCAPLP